MENEEGESELFYPKTVKNFRGEDYEIKWNPKKYNHGMDENNNKFLPIKRQIAIINNKDVQDFERPEPRPFKPDAKCMVSDLNYYMDGYLKDNLNEVPKFLKKGWDCVIIVSGSSKVRIGKSSIAMQMAYYIAYLINESKKKKGLVPKDNPTPFTNDNVVYNPDQLMKKAQTFPKNSVIVYDEGRAGLDSARAMENINKATIDFFQECGQYNHVILIVLPDFFKLSETIAVPRSLFLINVYTDRFYNRGFFSFYNEAKKEMLYIFGKKRYGSTSKYHAVQPNFHGKFTEYFPINKELYDQQKLDSLKQKQLSTRDIKWKKRGDIAIYLLNKVYKVKEEEIAMRISYLAEEKYTQESVSEAIARVIKQKEGLFNK